MPTGAVLSSDRFVNIVFTIAGGPLGVKVGSFSRWTMVSVVAHMLGLMGTPVKSTTPTGEPKLKNVPPWVVK
jgi:hypothetical protein